jgi:hypothetical protein
MSLRRISRRTPSVERRNRRRTLVVLRAGDMSLHTEWLQGAPPEIRTWDLHLSYFGDQSNPFPNRPADVTLSFERGSKAIGTVACLDALGNRVAGYDWVWLPDDDLSANLPTLNRFFEIVREHKLDLAQPALGHGSYVAHDITVQRPHMRLRYTTFVEIMAPCFSRRALKLCRPYLDATLSSWGPNHLFPSLLGYPERKIAIVDETPVVHTRPVGGGPNSSFTRQFGVNPRKELEDFLRVHRLQPRFDTWAGIDLTGQLITDLPQIDGWKAFHF